MQNGRERDEAYLLVVQVISPCLGGCDTDKTLTEVFKQVVTVLMGDT